MRALHQWNSSQAKLVLEWVQQMQPVLSTCLAQPAQTKSMKST
jgi:hypothetical protein